MNIKRVVINTRRTLLTSVFLSLFLEGYSQKADSTLSPKYFGGSVAATNNGISILPTFSLNKPAALLSMTVGNRLTFEPDFRFALEGKPWAFIFWWRYKLVQKDRFRLSVGAHPGFLFISKSIISNGVTTDIITTERYVAGDVSPNYYITKNTSIGCYYLRSHGFQESSVKNTHFVTINANFSKISLYRSYYLKFNPQVYYLKMDDNDGYYVTSTFTLAKVNFPLSVQSIMNKPIETKIPGGETFLWNITLVYSFGKQYQQYVSQPNVKL